jgi:predicted ATPase
LEVDGYRSLRGVTLDFGRITLVTGANGVGKTNIYRALQIARACGAGDVARQIVAEGGMPSVVWAGRRHGEPVVRLAVDFDGARYEVSLATVSRGDANRKMFAFPLDPVITTERIELPDAADRPVEMLDRSGATAFVRDEEGHRVVFPAAFHGSESVLSQLMDARQYPELAAVREALLGMRFHHQLRTDEEAPARRPSLGTRTLAVADDGSDLAAALATIQRDGDRRALEHCVAEAFDGAQVVIDEDDDSGRLDLLLDTGSLFRPLVASELSDGQLRFLFLAAVLLAPRPPGVVVLNEPEASLHTDLLPALAHLVEVAAEWTQVVLTTHAVELVRLLRSRPDAVTIELDQSEGATRVV